MNASFYVATPVKNYSPISVKEENLAVEADMELLPLDILVSVKFLMDLYFV